MILIKSQIKLKQLVQDCQAGFSDMVKIVIDTQREIIAADAELHADLEEYLLEDGSVQQNLWGANIYPEKSGEDFIEYTAFINIRPSQDNRSMEVETPEIRENIKRIVKQKILI